MGRWVRIQLRSKARNILCEKPVNIVEYFECLIISLLFFFSCYLILLYAIWVLVVVTFCMQTPFDAYYIPLISPHTKQQTKQWPIIHLLHFLCFHLFYKNFTILFVMCIHLNLFSSLLFSFQVCIQVIICSYVRHISSSLENIFVFERWCCSFFLLLSEAIRNWWSDGDGIIAQ